MLLNKEKIKLHEDKEKKKRNSIIRYYLSERERPSEKAIKKIESEKNKNYLKWLPSSS